MRKLLLLSVGLVLLVSVVAGLFFYFSLDGIVRRAIVDRIEEATGVNVQLQSVRLSAKNQSGELFQFRLGNPSGYPTNEPLFRFEQSEVGLDVASVRAPVVRIRKVELQGVTVFFSGGASGNNLKALAAQVAARTKTETPPASTESSRRVSIGTLVIADARIRLDLPGVGHTPELSLGTIRLNNLGGKDGDLPGQIMGTISSTVADRATAEVIKSIPRVAVELGLSPEKMAEMLGVPLPGPVREAADLLRGIFGR